MREPKPDEPDRRPPGRRPEKIPGRLFSIAVVVVTFVILTVVFVLWAYG